MGKASFSQNYSYKLTHSNEIHSAGLKAIQDALTEIGKPEALMDMDENEGSSEVILTKRLIIPNI